MEGFHLYLVTTRWQLRISCIRSPWVICWVYLLYKAAVLYWNACLCLSKLNITIHRFHTVLTWHQIPKRNSDFSILIMYLSTSINGVSFIFRCNSPLPPPPSQQSLPATSQINTPTTSSPPLQSLISNQMIQIITYNIFFFSITQPEEAFWLSQT